jgi:hypothetical protein
MLPREANNSHKYDLKRKNSVDQDKPKLTGLQAIQQRQDSSKGVGRPQTAAPSKLTKPKPRSGIPGISGSKPQTRAKAKTEAPVQATNTQAAVGQDRIRNLLRSNPNGAAASLKRETDGISGRGLEVNRGIAPRIANLPTTEPEQNDAAKKLDQSIKNAYKLRMNQFEDSQANDIGI